VRTAHADDDSFGDLEGCSAPIAQQEAAGFIIQSTTSFAALSFVVALFAAYWPQSQLQDSAPVFIVATLVLIAFALKALLRPPSLAAAPHLVGVNALVLSVAAATHVWLSGDPFQVQFLLVVVSGIGARVSVTPWLVAGFTVAWVPVVGALVTDSGILWWNGALVLATATALGTVVHVARKRREEQIDQLSARLRRQAHHDRLTGLANRHGLELLSGLAMAAAQRLGQDVGVLFVDLDGVKAVNDEQGHQAGDELLRSVARQLDSDFRGADVVARIGGDEFVVLVSGHALDPEQLTQRCRASLRRASHEASVGCAVSRGGADPLETLIARADEAMYDDKRARRAALPSDRP